MRNASVIGMTTSGAARYQSVLREIGPKIIVVEEAAEVLEAHIITTLSKKCEHLILIGDHKQLRPNPTVCKLAVKYNLDISLFERMVKSGMKFNCLELQHRMRPEISSIMRHIYPDLKDHEHVKSYPNVKGISKDVFLVNHSHLESSDENIKSYSNQEEARYAAALCRYLLLQGYESHEITVLTTYTGQLMCLKNLMPKEEFNGVKVTVVDNYQGEENEIVILSLVRSNAAGKIGFLKTENRICVALSRAKVGFFVLGNFDHLAKHSKLWNEITEDMKKKNCIGEGLTLYCQNHPHDDAILAKSHEDFKKAPEGGCRRKCDVRLNCGHKCDRFCHVIDQKHETEKSRCQKACMKTCELGHKCPDKCFKECRPCAVPVIKTLPKCEHSQSVPCAMRPEEFSCEAPCKMTLKCGHLCQNLCGMEHTSLCAVQMNFTRPCGHCAAIKCWEGTGSKPCPQPCRTVLKCGHKCTGTCGTCFTGRVHQPCQVKSTHTLYCGHKSETSCQNVPICPELCKITCDHKKCTKRCTELCDPCKEPCSWICPHYRCTRLCSEVCDRPRCDKPCQELLKCKHKCIGLCGEPCPSICRKCDINKFKNNVFGYKYKPTARFVLLDDCGHLVELLTMDKYMLEVKRKKNIRLKCCPVCTTPIRKCRRYGSIIKPIVSDIECAKKAAIGDTSLYNSLELQVFQFTDGNSNDINIYTNIENGIIAIIEALALYPCYYYKSMCKKNFLHRLKYLENGFLTGATLLTLQRQLSIAREIIALQQRILENGTQVKTANPRSEANYMLFLHELLLNITKPRDVLTMQEIEDFKNEIQRGKTYIKLLKIKSQIHSAKKIIKAYCDVLKIQSLLLKHGRLTQAEEKDIDICFKRLDELIKSGSKQTTATENARSTVLSTEQWLNVSNKCTCIHKPSENEHTCSPQNTPCCADEILFGDFDLDFLPAKDNSRIGTGIDEIVEEKSFGDFDLLLPSAVSSIEMFRDDTDVLSVEDIQFGDFDRSSRTETTRIAMNRDSVYTCSAEDIHVGDFVRPSENEPSSIGKDRDTKQACSIADVHFEDFDRSSANEHTCTEKKETPNTHSV